MVHSADAPELNINKSLSDIMLNGSSIAAPIPGAVLIYRISYSNSGNAAGDNALIYDELPDNTKYNTNYMLPPATGWTSQFSAAADPDQDYGSVDYTNCPPSVKTNVTWIRWRKPFIQADESGILIYKVIIK